MLGLVDYLGPLQHGAYGAGALDALTLHVYTRSSALAKAYLRYCTATAPDRAAAWPLLLDDLQSLLEADPNYSEDLNIM